MFSDIKVKEQSLENLLRGRKIFEPPHYMRVHQAAQQLLTILQRHSSNPATSGKDPVGEDEMQLTENTQCVGIVRVGTSSQRIMRGTLKGEADHCFDSYSPSCLNIAFNDVCVL